MTTWPCPVWCSQHSEWPGGVGHRGDEHQLAFRGPVEAANRAVVWLDQSVENAVAEAVTVHIGARVAGGHVVEGLHPDDPMSVDEAEAFALTLLEVVRLARTGPVVPVQRRGSL